MKIQELLELNPTTSLFYLRDLEVKKEEESEYLNLLEELGLKANTEEEIGVEIPIPFIRSEGVIERIITTLCPSKISIQQYQKTFKLPIDILRTIKWVKEQEFFDFLYIQYRSEDPDPFLMGIKEFCYSTSRYEDVKALEKASFAEIKEAWEQSKRKIEFEDYCVKYTAGWAIKPYVIAKWGAEKYSWTELHKRAKEMYLIDRTKYCKTQLSYYQTELRRLEEDLDFPDLHSVTSDYLPF